ncbi:hypothetical protein Droror1_Dr00000895 [Drosera rotundifolia]
MVADHHHWILKLISKKPTTTTTTAAEKQTIGILSFEVANVLSKLIHLDKSLTDPDISTLKSSIVSHDGVRRLVSSDTAYLLDLARSEKLDDLDRIADTVSRLGRKCSVPALKGFEHVYRDLVDGRIGVRELRFLVRDMEAMVRRMERYVRETRRLYVEMEVLRELENGVKKMVREESRRVVEQKVVWQRGDVRGLREASLWNQTYDRVIGLMARTVCTLYDKIVRVFGDVDEEVAAAAAVSRRRDSVVDIGSRVSSVVNGEGSICSPVKDEVRDDMEKRDGVLHCCSPVGGDSGGLRKKKRGVVVRNRDLGVGLRKDEVDLFQQDFAIPCGPSPGRVFLECLSLTSSGLTFDDDEDDGYHSGADRVDCLYRSGYLSGSSSFLNGMARAGIARSVDRQQFRGSLNASMFGSKSRLAVHTTPSTLGGSALALHYANVIIVIEKLLRYPHLVGDEARDDLYQMLPTSLRRSLKMSLKSYCTNMAIYDAPLAYDWKVNLDGILKWLAPLAHNMIRWQSERNVEQQQIVKRTNVLLLQTLYFADRAKTEVAICDLLVGLNYICRYEQQQNALLDCAGSFDFGDWMEWQSQYQSAAYGDE